MAKIKELLAGREKLAKYDELTEWKKEFEGDYIRVLRKCNKQVGELIITIEPRPLPDHIKSIIVAALDAEIKKLDEE